jgi:signal transduction histidine kinase
MLIEVADGPDVAHLTGREFPRRGSVSGEVMSSGEATVLTGTASDQRRGQFQVELGKIGPAAFFPLWASNGPFGTLAVARLEGGSAFDPADLEMLQAFAAQASISIEYERSRDDLQRLARLEDQERIARDLHDTVIQRLFAIGLSLQGALRLLGDEQAAGRIQTAVDDLDETVKEIRSAIFGLGVTRDNSDGLRARVLDVVNDCVAGATFDPHVVFDGPVDTTPDDLGADLLATLREALTNVVRHAGATRVSVSVNHTGTAVVVKVSDDGAGGPGSDVVAGNGVVNMRERAERRRGSLELRPASPHGTVLEWTVPLS